MSAHNSDDDKVTGEAHDDAQRETVVVSLDPRGRFPLASESMPQVKPSSGADVGPKADENIRLQIRRTFGGQNEPEMDVGAQAKRSVFINEEGNEIIKIPTRGYATDL